MSRKRVEQIPVFVLAHHFDYRSHRWRGVWRYSPDSPSPISVAKIPFAPPRSRVSGWGTVTCLAPVEWAIRKLGYSASICIHAPLFPAVSVNPGTRLLRTVRPRSPELWPAAVSARRTQSSRHTLPFSPSPSSLACDDSAPSPGIGPRRTRGCANMVWRFIVSFREACVTPGSSSC